MADHELTESDADSGNDVPEDEQAPAEDDDEQEKNKQYYLSDYIFGEVANVNFESGGNKTKGNNKKGKKNKKIILFSTSMNHY